MCRRTEGSASEHGCQLDITLFSERVEAGEAAQLFPYNSLRNAALLAASTELVLLGDADLLVGSSMNAALEDEAGYVQAASFWLVELLVSGLRQDLAMCSGFS